MVSDLASGFVWLFESGIPAVLIQCLMTTFQSNLAANLWHLQYRLMPNIWYLTCQGKHNREQHSQNCLTAEYHTASVSLGANFIKLMNLIIQASKLQT